MSILAYQDNKRFSSCVDYELVAKLFSKGGEIVFMDSQYCQYLNSKNEFCSELADMDSDYCYWHDPNISKEGDKVKEQLEAMVREGKSLEGFCLQYADLAGAHFECTDGDKPINLSFADLAHANLQGAHLFKVNFSNASLLKASLIEANLNFANLSGANLLGTRLINSKLEHVVWGKQIQQEVLIKKARKKGEHEQLKKLYLEAEESYRNLFKECETRGLYDEAGIFFQREKRMQRKQYPRLSIPRVSSSIVDLSTGYGENPLRVVMFSLMIIFCWSLLYFACGVGAEIEIMKFSLQQTAAQNLGEFLNCLYFSVVTFTTLGYGDIAPIGITKFFAAIEAFLGAFTMALFIVVFVKKMTR